MRIASVMLELSFPWRCILLITINTQDQSADKTEKSVISCRRLFKELVEAM